MPFRPGNASVMRDSSPTSKKKTCNQTIVEERTNKSCFTLQEIDRFAIVSGGVCTRSFIRQFSAHGSWEIHLWVGFLGNNLRTVCRYFSASMPLEESRPNPEISFSLGGESLAVAQNTYAVSWFKGRELNMVFGLQLSFSRVVSQSCTVKHS